MYYKRKRIIGSEQEYGVWAEDCAGNNELNWEIYDPGCLPNGGYLLIDCQHPEYSSPEASNPRDAVLFDKAGEAIVRAHTHGRGLKLFKNNTDRRNFYGSHESYSLKRQDMAKVAEVTIPFLATRIIFAGAGKINLDGEYEISQKASATTVVTIEDTTRFRGLFNTRDEPLADNGDMRLHVVSGDGNLSEPALYLKYGTTALVLDLLEDRKVGNFCLEDALETFHAVSKDLTFGQKYKTNLGLLTAIEIQRTYLEQATSAYSGRDEMTDDLLSRWKSVLDALESDPLSLSRSLDWAIKKKLIDGYVAKTGRSFTDTAVRNIDLEYHNVNPEKGFFYLLQRKGLVDRLVTDQEIAQAVTSPPQDTRARIRALAAVNSELRQKEIKWGSITFASKEKTMIPRCVMCPIRECAQYENRQVKIEIPDPFNPYLEREGEFK